MSVLISGLQDVALSVLPHLRWRFLRNLWKKAFGSSSLFVLPTLPAIGRSLRASANLEVLFANCFTTLGSWRQPHWR